MNATTKRQTRKVGVAGGFINQMYGNNATTPEVGNGATILGYSDRHPYEVLEVSEDGNKAVIRALDAKLIGEYFTDSQKYNFKSNPNNTKINIEWNDKKQCWGIVGYEVRVIKSLQNKLYKEYYFDWYKHLPNNVKFEDLYIDFDNSDDMKIIKGITKEYKVFSKISIIFGTAEKYDDPHF